jgi:hypothetical protein
MDEYSNKIGASSRGKVLAEAGTSRKGSVFVRDNSDREWVTVLEYISADSRKISLLIIFKGTNLQSTWFPVNFTTGCINWHFTCSQNGWTANDIGLEWLRRKFIPETTPIGPEQPQHPEWRLLLVNGHSSHIPVEFMKLALDNYVYVFYLPAYTLHITQPLDLTVFSSIKARYQNELKQITDLDDSAPIKKRNFIKLYSKIRLEGLSERNIRSG